MFYNHYIYNKNKVKTFIIHFNNNDDNILTISRSISPVFFDSDTKDVFFLKDTLYIFSIEHYRRSYDKTFQYIETKWMYKKNKIYIKTAKQKAKSEAIKTIKRIYYIYYEEFTSYNNLFKYLRNKYTDSI